MPVPDSVGKESKGIRMEARRLLRQPRQDVTSSKMTAESSSGKGED